MIVPTDHLERVRELVGANRDQFRGDFEIWLVENFEIWREFERRASALWWSGRKHFGAKCIVESIRFDTALREKEVIFKINNNVVSSLARLYLLVHPDRDGFLETRARSAA